MLCFFVFDGFNLITKCCLELTAKTLRRSKVKKQSHQSCVKYWLWWMDTILKGLVNSKRNMFSSWDLMGRRWTRVIEWRHLSGKSFSFTLELIFVGCINIVQRKNDAFVNVNVGRKTTAVAKIKMKQGFLSVSSNQSSFSWLLIQASCYC